MQKNVPVGAVIGVTEAKLANTDGKEQVPPVVVPAAFVKAADFRSETLYLVSCVSKKRTQPSLARDLYVSDWFVKARRYVESTGSPWFILSAEHGLVAPEQIIVPYERTLNTMSVLERRVWAQRVQAQMASSLPHTDRIVIFAGQRYREFLIDYLRSRAKRIDIPLERLRIGEQLAWFSEANDGEQHTESVELPVNHVIGSIGANALAEPASVVPHPAYVSQTAVGNRQRDLIRFYAALDTLEAKLGGKRMLSECDGRLQWPPRGVYFFFEPGEMRAQTGRGLRVVRVGTHALKEGSNSTLWNRLSQHRGTAADGGNHRGSIFRLLAGAAMQARDHSKIGSWGIGSDPKSAARQLGIGHEEMLAEEGRLEASVSGYIQAMPFLWLDIGDGPRPQSDRGFIERNSIALLSNFEREPLDMASDAWLGLHCDRARVRGSGLWNNNHVEELYDTAFLDMLEQYVRAVPDR
jgi:hypothetical protein